MFERLIEALAAVALGAATALAIVKLAPLGGFALLGAGIGGALVAGSGAFVALSWIGGVRDACPAFEPVNFAADNETDIADLDELLLDQPVAPTDPDSRVVRLFGAEPLPQPGELVARISDYLETGRPTTRVTSHAAQGEASAALHAALADIRRSLR